MQAQHFLRGDVGRYWVALSLREAETVRGALHVAIDDDAPLVPGSRCGVGLRIDEMLLDAVGAAQLDGSAEASRRDVTISGGVFPAATQLRT